MIKEELGFCTYTISNKDFYVDNADHLYEGKTWYELELESLRVPASSWAAFKAYILSQCKKHKDCRDDLPKVETKLEQFDEAVRYKFFED